MQFKRLFTQGSSDPYSLIHFRQPEGVGDGFDIPLEHPDGWSRESVEILADEAASCALNPDVKPIEENTVPSWLWRQSRARAAGAKETSVRTIFDRVAGAAAYKGWQHRLFVNEAEAKIFYDEARYMLAQRFIAIEPQKLAMLGLGWAYGIEIKYSPAGKSGASDAVNVSNAMIDTIVSGKNDRSVVAAWHKIINARTKPVTQKLRFADTEAQWETPADQRAGAWLNLMAFRHNDGTVNIEALKQATCIAVMLMDLQDEASGHALAIGYANLAPLLMAMALPYDSEAGRATASAISAIITAEAYATSAELAAWRGVTPAFTANRDACLRALRNHRRAAYGEHNDYEKMSVTPTPLALKSCPDLALTAAARSSWDRALDFVQAHGLRHTQVTSLFTSPALTMLMENESNGLLPMRSLAIAESETATRRTLHPSVMEGLARLGYSAKDMQPIVRHVAGTATLDKAPAINHQTLRARGLTDAALANLEAYLPQVKNIRYAFTPWILGVPFCRDVLKIPAAKIEDVRFNMLAHLGFSDDEIMAANGWCYGHDKIDGAVGLNMQHAAIFATAHNLAPEAHIRMAAAVQGLVSGESDLRLALPVGLQAERYEKLLLDAWRRGVKSLSITFDPNLQTPAQIAEVAAQRRTLRKIATSVFLHTSKPALPKRQSRSARPRTGSTAGPSLAGKAKSRSVSKGH